MNPWLPDQLLRALPPFRDRTELMSIDRLPDGAWVTVSFVTHEAQRWDPRTGEVLARRAVPYGPRSVRVSPDGTRLLTAGRDQAITVWDVATCTVLRTFTGHGYDIPSARWSPDGTRIVSACADGTVRVWSVDGNDDPLVIEVGEQWQYGAELLADGRILIAGAAGLLLFDGTGRRLQVLDDEHVHTCVAVSDDGFAVSGTEAKWVLRFDLSTGRCSDRWKAHRGFVYRVAFAGDRVVSGGKDKLVKVFAPGRAKHLHLLRGHEGVVTDLWTDGVELASVGDAGALLRWDLATGKRLPEPEPRGLTVEAGDTLDVCAEDGLAATARKGAPSEVAVWDLRTGALVATLPHTSMVVGVRPRDGGWLTLDIAGVLRAWPRSGGEGTVVADLATPARALEVGPDRVAVTVVDDDGDCILLLDRNGGIERHEGFSRALLGEDWCALQRDEGLRILQSGRSHDHALPSDGGWPAMALIDASSFVVSGWGWVQRWSVDGRCAWEASCDAGAVAATDRHVLVVGSEGQVLDARTGEPIATLRGHTQRITAVATDQVVFVTAADGSRILVWGSYA